MRRKRENFLATTNTRKIRRKTVTPPPPSSSSTKSSPATVIVSGISPECSLLDVKSRFEVYGCISRTTMLNNGVAYVTYRDRNSAQDAVHAGLDESFAITLDHVPVQVMWANDLRERVSLKDISPNSSSSKLVRPEVPLSRHGRSKRLGSTIVSTRSVSTDSMPTAVAFKGRKIVAYDDIL